VQNTPYTTLPPKNPPSLLLVKDPSTYPNRPSRATRNGKRAEVEVEWLLRRDGVWVYAKIGILFCLLGTVQRTGESTQERVGAFGLGFLISPVK